MRKAVNDECFRGVSRYRLSGLLKKRVTITSTPANLSRAPVSGNAAMRTTSTFYAHASDANNFRHTCAWNIYLKEQRPQHLELPWGQFMQRMSPLFKALPSHERQSLEHTAADTNQHRVVLSQRVLGKSDADENLSTRQLQRLAQHRMGATLAAPASHAAWQSGLGISNSNGALKPDLVDARPNSQVFKQEVGNLFGYDPSVQVNPVPAPTYFMPCWRRYGGMCCKDPQFARTTRAVSQLQDTLIHHKVDAGALLCFLAADVLPDVEQAVAGERRMDDDGEEENEGDGAGCKYFVLGATAKLHLMHVLLAMKVVAGEIAGNLKVELQSERHGPQSKISAIFNTSHRELRAMFVLQEMRSSPEQLQIEVQVLKYEAKGSVNGNHLQIIGEPLLSFRVGDGCQAPPRPPSKNSKVELPFGLQMPKKQRKKRIKENTTDVPDHSSKGKSLLEKLSGQVHGDPGSSGSDSDSSADEPVDEQVGAAVPGGDDVQSDDVVLSATATRERGAADRAYKTFLSDNAVNSSSGAAGDGAKAKARPTTLRLGITGVGLSPSNHSVCMICGETIPKHDVRFTYSFDTRRPSRYVHADCVPHIDVALRPVSISWLSEAYLSSTEPHVDIIGRLLYRLNTDKPASTSSQSSSSKIASLSSESSRSLLLMLFLLCHGCRQRCHCCRRRRCCCCLLAVWFWFGCDVLIAR
jgi:hypothetical protein